MMPPFVAFAAFAAGVATDQVVSTLETAEAQEDVLPFTRFVSGGVDGPKPTVSTSFATRKHEVVIYSRLQTAHDDRELISRVSAELADEQDELVSQAAMLMLIQREWPRVRSSWAIERRMGAELLAKTEQRHQRALGFSLPQSHPRGCSALQAVLDEHLA